MDSSVIECNAETKQLHPTHLTQGPIAHRYFWGGGGEDRPGFLHCPFHHNPHILDGIHFYDSICLVEGFGLHST